ncbi:MAG: hypothetical protein COA79_04055 [Planctomycetota bacterium]|nr:MAG: hypothetical protein COA79_04055 [Planctomycetota bacterium]
MAKKVQKRARSRTKQSSEKSSESKSRSKEKPKKRPKAKKQPIQEDDSNQDVIVPPIPDKIECECGFKFKKLVEETYGSFKCPKCDKFTSLEVEEKIFLNNKNITVMVVAFVLCFVLYFGVEIAMGVWNQDKPTTLKLFDEDKKQIFEIFPTEED